MIESDLCIIGGGTAGITAAVAGAALGLKTVLVERDRGDESYRDADTLLAVLAADLNDSSLPEGLDLSRLRQRIGAALAAAAPERRLARIAALNVHVLRGHGRFDDPRSITVDGTPVTARRFLLATGALSAPSGLGADRIVGLDTLRLMPCLPPKLLLVGGDGTTAALAQAMNRFGSEVTLCAPSGLLSGADPELVAPVRQRMRQNGIAIVEDGINVAATSGGVEAVLTDGRRLLASHVYGDAWACPRLDELDLDRAGIATSDTGIVLSPSLRTTNPRVYAAGALAGAASPQAIQAQVATIVKAAFFRLPTCYRPRLVPRTFATSPAIATVGIDETEARRLGPIAVWRWPLAETQAGRTDPGAGGHVKVIATPAGRLLGAGIVGPAAAEQIGLWTLALATRTTIQQMAETALPASAYADASRRALTGFTAERLRGHGLRWALAVLNRLG